MKKIAMAVLLSASVAAPAVAADDMHMYAGARVGKANTSIDNAVLTKDNPNGWGAFLGYSFSPMFALEGEYLNFGTIEFGTDGIKSSGLSLSGVASFPIGEEFSLFGKLGYAKITSKPTGTATGSSLKSSGVAYGFGGQYNISPVVGIRLGWDKYKIDDTDDTGYPIKGDVSLISIGGVFKF